MAKIKDKIEQDKLFAEKELEASEPRYQYFDTKGEHLHTYAGKPLIGTSTVINVLSKPLTYWASGLACQKFGWLNPKKYSKEERLNAISDFRSKDFTDEEWLSLCDEAYHAHKTSLKDSAEAGTDLHAEAEKFVKDHINGVSGKYDEKIKCFIDWTHKNVKRFLWSESNCYSLMYWVGGISDCGAELNDGSYVIIDFKSSKEAYQSQFIQIAGYALQIEENGIYTKNGELIQKFEKEFSQYVVFPFGAEVVEAQYRFNVDELKEGFKSALVLHKLTNN